MDQEIPVYGEELHVAFIATPKSSDPPKLLWDCLSAGQQTILSGKNVTRVVIVASGTDGFHYNGRAASVITGGSADFDSIAAGSRTAELSINNALHKIVIGAIADVVNTAKLIMFIRDSKAD